MSKTKPRVIDGLSFSKLVSGKNIGASPHPTQPSLKSILIATFSTLSSLDEAIVEVLQAICAVHLHRDDWEGHDHVTHIVKGKYGVSVAADESCYSCLVDAKRIITGNLADFINIKLAKVGIVGGLEIIEEARTSGLDPMIGGMVETRLAMGFTGHLAAGFGCFK
ncbi:PREDICTED: L-Ala-D/L-amino acid epimerase-like [Populus euphratica]|uniref:L-Ala-D/L-amino acid epimerase-like n=1 Tax=Populus euphratica TaxID=75702 RepID=A0AAJ6TBK4_POPEU|nr:PREDICTED: L-Ala-D/L-amino acid epimerase-like [Populus euphratica]